jgi:hypothetical protein
MYRKNDSSRLSRLISRLNIAGDEFPPDNIMADISNCNAIKLITMTKVDELKEKKDVILNFSIIIEKLFSALL